MTKPPIILFDGVCNLCNAAVQWVIARDRRAAFRFASLQSRAGRESLREAGAPAELPDSIVFIENGRVLTRSDAAIGIARRLGFPWSLAAVGCVVPRSLRDGIYSWVAANRYRWFGKQNACMVPTPELRARFLDADEPPMGAASDAGSAPSPTMSVAKSSARPGPLSFLAAFVQRLLLAYLVIYIFPFPAGVIPFTGWLPPLFESVLRPTVIWVGKAVFGTEITVMPNGSGDTTYNYVEISVFASAALAAALVWTLWKRATPVSQRVVGGVTLYVRYCLAMFLFAYGWTKVFPNQMPMPGPDRLIGTIGDMSPMGLVWTFMGASTAYQIFAGAAEVLGGLLLLWRRTSLAGGLVAVGVMTNVVALNYCYDVPVKLFSSHLLLMAIFLCLPHLPRLFAVLVLNLPAQPAVLRPFPFKSRWMRAVALAAKLVLVLFIAVLPAYGDWQFMHSHGLLAPARPWEGVYRVESFIRDGIADRALEDADRWVRVGIGSHGVGAIQRADGSTRRHRMEVDEEKGTLTITRRGDPAAMTLRFATPEPDRITLEGEFDGKPISVTLKRSVEDQPFLTTRGFHWINEFPLNR